MNFGIVREIMMKDLQDIRRNGYVFFSLIFLPMIITALGILETVSLASTGSLSVSGSSGSTIDVSGTFTALFVIIPAVLSTLIGSTSVIMEKTNHTLEPLLSTPITDTEIFAGKSMAPSLPVLGFSMLAFGLFMGISDAITYNELGYLLFPTTTTYVEMFYLIPVVAFLGTFASLFISSKMKDVRAAQQVSAIVILPILLLIYIPLFAAGSDLMLMLIMGTIMLALVIVLFFVVSKTFKRETILISWSK